MFSNDPASRWQKRYKANTFYFIGFRLTFLHKEGKLNILTTHFFFAYSLFNMVKNTRGGTGTKSLARKNVNRDFEIDSPPLPQDQFQRVVRIVKPLGNGILLVQDSLYNTLFAHLRNLSRRKLSFSPNDALLVSLRPFENPHKHADVLFVYLAAHHSFLTCLNTPDDVIFFQRIRQNGRYRKIKKTRLQIPMPKKYKRHLHIFSFKMGVNK